MKKNTSLVSKLAAAACALTLVATPAVAFAQTTTNANDPIVAQGVYDYTDAILVAVTDSGYAPSVVYITDLDTYVNEYGALVDYVEFEVGSMRFCYEVDCIDGSIWYKNVFVI